MWHDPQGKFVTPISTKQGKTYRYCHKQTTNIFTSFAGPILVVNFI